MQQAPKITAKESMADQEPSPMKRAKCSHNGSDLIVTEEMMEDFSRDGYIIVK